MFDIIRSLVDKIIKEWATIKKIPITLTFIVLMSMAIAIYVVNLHYAERIENLNSTITLKEQKITDLEDRLERKITTDTAYSILTNSELKDRTLKLTKNIKELNPVQKEI